MTVGELKKLLDGRPDDDGVLFEDDQCQCFKLKPAEESGDEECMRVAAENVILTTDGDWDWKWKENSRFKIS